jgi:hypothetical protein
VNPVNEHGDMIAITAYYRREAELKAQVDDLQRQLDNARTGWLCETCDGRECEGQRQSELMFAENEALREKVYDWENAVAHALDHRSDEQHCTCVAPLVGKVKQLERANAELRADKERLDWLAQLPDKRLSRVHDLWVNDGDIADMRAALDAARKEQP